MHDGGRAVEQQGRREGAQRIEPFAGQRDSSDEPHQGSAAENAHRSADDHLDSEIDDRVPNPGCGHPASRDQAGHQSDADRIVRPGLALQDDTARSADLTSAQNREHHRRVGRG